MGAPLPAISHFAEEQSPELRDRIFDEFNSLAVVLRAPSANFIQESHVSAADDALEAPAVSSSPIAFQAGSMGSAGNVSHV